MPPGFRQDDVPCSWRAPSEGGSSGGIYIDCAVDQRSPPFDGALHAIWHQQPRALDGAATEPLLELGPGTIAGSVIAFRVRDDPIASLECVG